MSADISRHSHRPAQRYAGLTWQQGRTPLDSEENEAQTILRQGMRDLVTTTICASGTPDDGFRVTELHKDLASGVYDLTYQAGSFFLGGLQLQSEGGRYSNQPDWLDFSIDSALPQIPVLAEGETRSDLVYLKAWEQEISAAEDSELFETALGGIDTTGRVRAMARLCVEPDLPPDCVDALATLTDAADDAIFLLDQAQLTSTTKLKIGFADPDISEDLCSPSAQPGYLGAHNDTFTLMITKPGEFVWTNDTTTYRVQVEDDPTTNLPRRIRFLTPPRDDFARPLAGQTIELLPWSSLLANNEKAGAAVGHFLTIATGYDADGAVVVDADVPAALRSWLTAQDPAHFGRFDVPGQQRFFFARIWSNGNGAQGSPSVSITGSDQFLGGTGLTARLTGMGRRGDMWRFSARPNTPARILPWGLLDGETPHAPRLHLAPLARIQWTGQANAPASARIIDCRNVFRQLCQDVTCCRVTVGDDHQSHGDVSSIREALDRLPEEGGHICLLQGQFVEHVTITGGRNITISGCGKDSQWVAETPDTPLLTLEGCEHVTVRNLSMTNLDGPAVEGRDLIEQGIAFANHHVTLEALQVRVGRAHAIDLPGGQDHRIAACQITAGDAQPGTPGSEAAVFMKGDRLLLEDCEISCLQPDTGPALALGGVHIGSMSEMVRIRRNRITGGLGNGVSFGTVRWVQDWRQPGGQSGGFSGVVELDANVNLAEVETATVSAGAANEVQAQDKKTYQEAEARAIREGFGDAKTRNRYKKNAELNHGYDALPLKYSKPGCLEIDSPNPSEGDDDVGQPLVPVADGPVRDVIIEDNEIANMGFNGIATYPLSILMPLTSELPEDAIAVEELSIRRNLIKGCMINDTPDLGAVLRQFVGWGGISLSLASDVTIEENRIEANGRTGNMPICGVFVAVGEALIISHNRILENGLGFVDGVAPQPGRRGGIVIGLGLGGVASTGSLASDRRQSNRPALACHNNEIDAPGARALKAILMGPAKITDNRLTGASESMLFANPLGAIRAAGLGAGTVGDDFFRPANALDFEDYLALELIAEAAGGDAVNLVNAGFAEDVSSYFGRFRLVATPLPGVQRARLTGGEMLINDNQISYRAYRSARSSTLSALFVAAADDVALSNNQIETENDVVYAVTPALVAATTLRASANRIQSRLNGALFSAVTLGEYMNNTSLNQGTHCFLVVAPQQGRVARDNTALTGMSLPQFCQAIERMACNISNARSEKLGLASIEC